MNYKQVIKHFGGIASTARALGIKSRQNVYAWGRCARIPSKWQIRIAQKTEGQLSVDAATRKEAREFTDLLNNKH